MKITEAQWYAHPDFRRELEELLKHPTMQIALQIVSDRGQTTTLPVSNQIIEWFALMGAKKDGYHESLANLEALSRPKADRPPERKAWDSPEKQLQGATASPAEER